ncbi:AmmeMemoRadiSam system protein B [Candidatus Omnitrophota bacterium]
MIRKPQVAGQFYPQSPAGLKKQLDQLIASNQPQQQALGLVAPHAGYVYSGAVAGLCFAKTKLTKTVIILGPNHTGLGPAFSIMSGGIWKMPLGDVAIDTALAKRILGQSKYLNDDTQAHLYEHSIEVQLPFLQYFLTDVKIVPIVLAHAAYETYDSIGTGIANALKEQGQKSLIIASSDMSHYQPQEQTQTNDNLALEAILDLDGEELLQRVKAHRMSICGYGPIACMLSAAKQLGAQKAELLKYQTSGDVSGDYSSVVGYAGVRIT